MDKELIEVLFILDGLFFRGSGFGQSHGSADGKAKNRTDIGTVLLRKDALSLLFRIFTVILNQPAKCRKAMQASVDRATELTAVAMRIFIIFFCRLDVTVSIALRLSESILDSSEEYFSLTLPSCCRVLRMELSAPAVPFGWYTIAVPASAGSPAGLPADK